LVIAAITGRYNAGCSCGADGGRTEEDHTWQLWHERSPHWAMLTEGREEATASLGYSEDSFPLIKPSLIWAVRSNLLVWHSVVSFSELSATAQTSPAVRTC